MAILIDSDPLHPRKEPWLEKIMKTSSNSHYSKGGQDSVKTRGGGGPDFHVFPNWNDWNMALIDLMIHRWNIGEIKATFGTCLADIWLIYSPHISVTYDLIFVWARARRVQHLENFGLVGGSSNLHFFQIQHFKRILFEIFIGREGWSLFGSYYQAQPKPQLSWTEFSFILNFT